jgi:hypothetical protein
VSTKHGMYGTPTHKSWTAMKGRVFGRLSDPRYYKELGIGICEPWLEFANFFADMGVRPEGTTLDRIDNAKGYEPGNCRWATKEQQIENRRNTRWIEHNGERLSVTEWSKRLGIKPKTILHRLDGLSWPVEDALNPAMNFRYVKNGVLMATARSLLDSKTRSALKKHHESLKAPA